MLVAIAMTFHITAIVALLLEIRRIQLKKWMSIPIAVLLLFVYIFRNQLGWILTSVAFEGEYLGYYESSGAIGAMSIFLLLILIGMILIEHECILEKDNISSLYFKIIIISLLIQMLSSYAYAFTRLNYYFVQFFPIIVPSMLDLLKTSKYRNQKWNILLFGALWLAFVFLSFYLYQDGVIQGNNTYNFKFLFQ